LIRPGFGDVAGRASFLRFSEIQSLVVSPRIFGTSTAFSGADGLPRASGLDDHREIGTGIGRGNGLDVEADADIGVDMTVGAFRDGFEAALLISADSDLTCPVATTPVPVPETWDRDDGCRPEAAPATLPNRRRNRELSILSRVSRQRCGRMEFSPHAQ
jgi:hypothetical protein